MVSGDGISIVVAETAPLAQASVDAVAIDASASDAMIASLVRSLRAKGRMLGPSALAVPDGLVEIARDEQGWVARLDVKVTVSAPVQLQRRER
jgi:protein-L-isoaspartate O-methyltransferase